MKLHSFGLRERRPRAREVKPLGQRQGQESGWKGRSSSVLRGRELKLRSLREPPKVPQTNQLLLFPLSILFLLICFQHPTPELYQELRGDLGLR